MTTKTQTVPIATTPDTKPRRGLFGQRERTITGAQVLRYRLSMHDGAEVTEGELAQQVVTPDVAAILLAHVFPDAARDDLDADLVETAVSSRSSGGNSGGGRFRWHGMAGDTILEWTREVLASDQKVTNRQLAFLRHVSDGTLVRERGGSACAMARRMEQAGLIARGLETRWEITTAGKRALLDAEEPTP